MTTKFLDNKICTFKIILSWRFPRKAAFLDDSPSAPNAPPGSQNRKFYFIVVSPSLMNITCNDLELYPLTQNYYENNSLRLICRNFEGFCGKERLFRGITREIRNF